jgi:hypothetical protein
MKISNQLLKTMALAVSLGSTTMACSKTEAPEVLNPKEKEMPSKPTSTPSEKPTPGDSAYNCPACGMG